MYTQCPQCQTTFRVTASMLKAARGQVRCGRCTHIFNALTYLVDDDTSPPQPAAQEPVATAAAAAPLTPTSSKPSPAPALPPTTAPAVSRPVRTPASEKRYDDNTPFEDEDEEPAEEIVLGSAPEDENTTADEASEHLVLEDAEELTLEGDSSPEEHVVIVSGDEELTVEDEAIGEPAAADVADEVVLDEITVGDVTEEEAEAVTLADDSSPEAADVADEDVPDEALEFTATDLAQVFVEAPAAPLPKLPVDGDETAEHEILDVELETPAPPEVITLEGESVVIVEGAEAAAALEARKEETPPPPRPKSQEAIDLEVRREIEKAFADDPNTRAVFVLPSGRKVTLHRNDEEVEVEEEEVEAAEVLERDTSRQRRARIAWGVSGVALAILLAVQVIHYNRQALAQSASVGPILTSIYGALGSNLTPEWKVQAYDVRQWGAAADPRTGTVRVRASVTNGADHAQPYPLLRLTLMNRYGERLRQSDIEPKDYLSQAPGAGELLGAGERVDANIVIVDPGDEAANFEIDVCLRRNAGVTCANDAPRQRG